MLFYEILCFNRSTPQELTGFRFAFLYKRNQFGGDAGILFNLAIGIYHLDVKSIVLNGFSADRPTTVTVGTYQRRRKRQDSYNCIVQLVRRLGESQQLQAFEQPQLYD